MTSACLYQMLEIIFYFMIYHRAFGLFEILVCVVIISIIGILGAKSLLYIYKKYEIEKTQYYKTISHKNALLQLKKILDSAYLESLYIKDDKIVFYEKIQERQYYKDSMLPCLINVFNPESIKLASNLSLEFLTLRSGFMPNCNVYNESLEVIFVGESFIFPNDFYSNKFRAKVISLTHKNLTSTMPPFLQNREKIKPYLYFIKDKTEILLQDSLKLVRNKEEYTILDKYDSFNIRRLDFGYVVELCVDEVCFSDVLHSEVL